jgi:hypothetical protein
MSFYSDGFGSASFTAAPVNPTAIPSFVVPMPTLSSNNSSSERDRMSTTVTGLNQLHHPDYMNLSPTSIRGHRYSDLLETGDYHLPASPTRESRVVRSLPVDNRRSSMYETTTTGQQQFQQQPQQQSRQSRSNRTPSISYLGSPSSYSDTGHVSRSQSIGHQPHHNSRTSISSDGRSPGLDHRMAYSPLSNSNNMDNHWTTTPQPPPQHRYHPTSPSMTTNSMPPPPVPSSDLMRRGTSYEGSKNRHVASSPNRPESSTLPANAGLMNPYATLETSNQMSRGGSNTWDGQQLTRPPGSNRTDTYSPSRYAAQFSNVPPPPLAGSVNVTARSPSIKSASSYYPQSAGSSSIHQQSSFPPPPLSSSHSQHSHSHSRSHSNSHPQPPPVLSQSPYPPSQSPYPPHSQSPYPQSSTPSHHPQAQPYYQSQRYFDSKLNNSTSLPTPTSASSTHSGSGHLGRSQSISSTTQSYGAQPSANVAKVGDRRGSGDKKGKGKGLQRVVDTRDIERVVNTQPKGRRGDPSGGFLSVSRAVYIRSICKLLMSIH